MLIYDTRPQVRADVIFGPPERSGRGTVYYVKDKVTNWFYRIGPREHFLITRMDGQRTLQQLGEEYTQRFGRHLDERSWQKLFELLDKRQLLVETATDARLVELRQLVEQRKKVENKHLLRKRFALVNPDAFLAAILPWFRWMFHPVFVVLVLLATLALEVAVALNLQPIAVVAWDSRLHPAVFVTFLIVLWLATVIHEIAHGLTCKRFGGSAPEIGILWRYLSFFPYCKIDDVVLFHNRWHRVYTAFAGMFASFVLLLPVGVLWWVLPAGGALKEFSALFLIVFNLSILLNLIPFVELDGYFILSHALGMTDLRKESHRFWLLLTRRLFLRQGEGIRIYARPMRYIYSVYGLLSLITTACFLGSIVVYWFRTLQIYLGSSATWSFFAIVFCLLACLWLSQRWSKRRFSTPGS